MAKKVEKFLCKCPARCWCRFCGKRIEEEEHYLRIIRNAQRGSTRTNICICCLNEMGKEINKKELVKVQKEAMLRELEK